MNSTGDSIREPDDHSPFTYPLHAPQPHRRLQSSNSLLARPQSLRRYSFTLPHRSASPQPHPVKPRRRARTVRGACPRVRTSRLRKCVRKNFLMLQHVGRIRHARLGLDSNEKSPKMSKPFLYPCVVATYGSDSPPLGSGVNPIRRNPSRLAPFSITSASAVTSPFI